MTMHDMMRAPNLMTDEEHAELLAAGWQLEVVDSLRLRGFRPCKPDYIAARFDGVDPRRMAGFLRQTSTPHLHITVERDTLTHVVLERIDTAIYNAGRLQGHESLAGHFMCFFDFCQRAPRTDPVAALEARLAKIEASLITHHS